MTHNEIANHAFEILEKDRKVTYVPIWVKNLILRFIRAVTSVKTYGPLEFFMTVLVMDMIAPRYGKHTIRRYFTEIKGGSHV